ncbi:DMT family protein [Fulvivirga ligni]|uniref:DMT family protein n=1 Tax=Fulvivirga ligni TaxID=2904246 RepID=UPI001F1E71C8|nr:DMT family protein [Fulvivirga ligni]UII20814.1 DMT family protein [Fulvivirga ligni]
MYKGLLTIILLVISNSFMILAWYGHLKFKEMPAFSKLGLIAIIFISWGIALFEYVFQVPANKIGFSENGGPFNLWQLKVIQEVITLLIFTIFTLIFFKNESFRINHVIGFIFMTLAVYFIFKK